MEYTLKHLLSHILATTHLRTCFIQNTAMFWNEKVKYQ